jgi:hypothetical protein
MPPLSAKPLVKRIADAEAVLRTSMILTLLGRLSVQGLE